MKTADLSNADLDYWVAQAEGELLTKKRWIFYSTSWLAAGKIIERERLLIAPTKDGGWIAWPSDGGETHEARFEGKGPTPLVAAMRSYVAMAFGKDVPCA